MTTQEAISEAIIWAERTLNQMEAQPEKWKDELPRQRAILSALREQEARENPKPLTLDELKERVGQPVWIVEGNQAHPSECETNCVEIFRVSHNERYIEFFKFGDEVEEGLLIEHYGKTWRAYDHKPTE